jgi:hypothetical protein
MARGVEGAAYRLSHRRLLPSDQRSVDWPELNRRESDGPDVEVEVEVEEASLRTRARRAAQLGAPAIADRSRSSSGLSCDTREEGEEVQHHCETFGVVRHSMDGYSLERRT